MRHIRNELLTHLIDLHFLVNILFKLCIRLFQFPDRCLEALRKHIHAVSKRINFLRRAAACLIAGIKIQVRHLFRQLRQPFDRHRNVPGNKINQNTSRQNYHDSNKHQKPV